MLKFLYEAILLNQPFIQDCTLSPCYFRFAKIKIIGLHLKDINTHWPVEVLRPVRTVVCPRYSLTLVSGLDREGRTGRRNLHGTFTIIVSLELDCAQALKNSFLSLFLFFQSNRSWWRRDTRRLPSTLTKPKWWAYRGIINRMSSFDAKHTSEVWMGIYTNNL